MIFSVSSLKEQFIRFLSNTTNILRETFSEKKNLIILFCAFAEFFYWYSTRFWQKPPVVQDSWKLGNAIFLNPTPTRILQQNFESSFLDVLTVLIWFFGFAVMTILLFLIVITRGKTAWKIGTPVVAGWFVNFVIQWFFPVIVPVRWDDFGLSLPPGIREVRFENWAASDQANGILYAGLPSAHLGVMLAGVILSLILIKERPDAIKWKITTNLFLISSILFSFSVIYLGEHYIEDLLASLVVWPVTFIIVWKIIHYFEKEDGIYVPEIC